MLGVNYHLCRVCVGSLTHYHDANGNQVFDAGDVVLASVDYDYDVAGRRIRDGKGGDGKGVRTEKVRTEKVAGTFVLTRGVLRGRFTGMGRPLRVDVGGYVYHVLNRGNARMTIFDDQGDYAAFERIMLEAQQRTDMRLLAWCLMPNHWHMIVQPRRDGDLARFFGWLTLTHTQRWHVHRHTTGEGHVYQGRYKSFLIEAEDYLLSACRYVERNALRAGQIDSGGSGGRAEDWRWGSLWRWANRRRKLSEAPVLSDWPIDRPRNWVQRVNQPQSQAELEALRQCTQRGRPYGSPTWVKRIAAKLDLKTTLTPRGRPRKEISDD